MSILYNYSSLFNILELNKNLLINYTSISGNRESFKKRLMNGSDVL